MILQSLARHYEDLTAQNLIAPPGWNQVKVSYALDLDEQGPLLRVASVRNQNNEGKGNKTVLIPRLMKLPAPVKRTAGISANFLCDNASYILGIDGKGNAKRAGECFAACKALHERLLSGVHAPAAEALLAFFRRWDPEQAAEHPALQDEIDGILAGANLVFRFRGAFIHEDPAIRQAWQTHYDAGGGPTMVCLVTGRETSVEAVHPAIKGVRGAQSSGAALVSFNAPAFCSYGKEQNYNAPTSKYAAFAYTSALNHLLADRNHPSRRIGDTTVVCWAEGGEPAFQDAFGAFAFGATCSYTEKELRGMVEKLLRGIPVSFDETLLNPDRPFYILGLAPNAARLSVRFFLRNSFGRFLENVRRHYERLKIAGPAYEKSDILPLWKLLGETVNQNSRDKTPSPNMAGGVLRSILMDEPYPATLLHGALLRIRAEGEVTRGRAAILKAYYLNLRPPNPDIPKEVLTVSLNPGSTNVPYTLGRLFSVLEAIQHAANPGINATIKDRYFNAASATPGHVFPILLKLSQKHLGKLEGGLRVYYDNTITELADILPETFPSRLNLPQQGAFQLGYYHQKHHKKKEENQNA